MWHGDRRHFLRDVGRGAVGASAIALAGTLQGQEAGQRAHQAREVRVQLPRLRVPVSLIIDDSTCLVNLNRFAIPQFQEAWGGKNFTQPWREMPVEIPDAFVQKFGQWCGEHGVRGKYSVVPFPACVGRLDRVLPGWTRREVDASIELVRNLMLPNWDIHPEMVTHTWAIDLKTGHPHPQRTLEYMENWEWSVGKSTDELADYFRYALQILKNVGLPCEGVTTPGGFGNRVRPQLAAATLQACRDVFQAEIPHYFRDLYDSGERCVAPIVQLASGLDRSDPQCVVSIIGCTGDWTGGWDCSDRGDVDRFIMPDLARGRMVEVIDRGQPAVMVCHWTGIYFNGEEVGFKIFQEVVRRLHARYNHLLWMKLSEIARYWAAKELTSIEQHADQIQLRAPFACPAFTLAIPAQEQAAAPRMQVGQQVHGLREVQRTIDLQSGTWLRRDQELIVCLDLPRGPSALLLGAT